MKPKVRLQSNSSSGAGIHKYIRIDDDIEILESDVGTSSRTPENGKSRNGFGASPSAKLNGNPYQTVAIKKEAIENTSTFYGLKSDCSKSNPRMPSTRHQPVVPNSPKKSNGANRNELKSLITYTPLKKETATNSNGSCSKVETNKKNTDVANGIKPASIARRLMIDMTPQALLPTSGKRISTAVNRDMYASVNSKPVLNPALKGINLPKINKVNNPTKSILIKPIVMQNAIKGASISKLNNDCSATKNIFNKPEEQAAVKVAAVSKLNQEILNKNLLSKPVQHEIIRQDNAVFKFNGDSSPKNMFVKHLLPEAIKAVSSAKSSRENVARNLFSKHNLAPNSILYNKLQFEKFEMKKANIVSCPAVTKKSIIDDCEASGSASESQIIYIKSFSDNKAKKSERKITAKLKADLPIEKAEESIKKARTDSTPGKKSGTREMKQLYKNLEEISWARDKEFKTLLNTKDSIRHSGRISGVKVAVEDRCKKLSMKKMKAPQRAKSKNALSTLVRKKLQKSAKIAIHKEVVAQKKSKKAVNPKSNKTKVKRLSQSTTSLKMKKDKKAIAKKQKTASKKVVNEKVKIMPKDTTKKILLKPVTDQLTYQKAPEEATQSSIPKNFEHIIQKLNVLGNLFSNTDETRLLFALNKGQELRVRLEPLESTDLWPSDFEPRNDASKYSAFTRKSIQENVLKVFAGMEQNSVTSGDDSSAGSSCSTKIPKKRKYEEECVRAISLRQNYKEIIVKRHSSFVQIVLVPSSNKQNSLTIEAMRELKDAFQYARKDPQCKAVLINSSGSYFCTGIDLSQLYGPNKKHAAEDMAQAVRDLVLTMAICPKPVVAAVNGCTVGLGVSLLTYCDIVLASDKATFCLPSARMGYIPEGGVALTLPQVVGSSVALEMLLYGRRLTAHQAFNHGLVSEILWPTQLMEQVVPRMLSLVEQSLPVMEATKTMVRCHLWEKLATQMNREWHLLPSQWLSNECQQNIKRHMKTGWVFD